MFYFAYGSNLNKKQMKRRCKDSLFLQKIILKNYTLCFRSKYGVADIDKKSGSKVYGALYKISKSDESKLDIYEEYPTLYKKMFFRHGKKIVMAYIMVKKTNKTTPTTRYFKTIKQGYRDRKINLKSLKTALQHSTHPRR